MAKAGIQTEKTTPGSPEPGVRFLGSIVPGAGNQSSLADRIQGGKTPRKRIKQLAQSAAVRFSLSLRYALKDVINEGS